MTEEVFPDLECEFHGKFPRHLMMCPKCYTRYVKRNKQIHYEQQIKKES